MVEGLVESLMEQCNACRCCVAIISAELVTCVALHCIHAMVEGYVWKA